MNNSTHVWIPKSLTNQLLLDDAIDKTLRQVSMNGVASEATKDFVIERSYKYRSFDVYIAGVHGMWFCAADIYEKVPLRKNERIFVQFGDKSIFYPSEDIAGKAIHTLIDIYVDRKRKQDVKEKVKEFSRLFKHAKPLTEKELHDHIDEELQIAVRKYHEDQKIDKGFILES